MARDRARLTAPVRIVRRSRRGYIEAGEPKVMKARVRVTLKSGLLDPQGKAIGNALKALGFSGVGEVRQGKLIELELDDADPELARARVTAMCDELLANPVIEDYAIELW